MTEELIKKINSKAPYEQGIFKQPWGIPVTIKDYVIYTRYGTGGYSGGSCYGDKAESYISDIPINIIYLR
jgi:hypothetical protein